jgi:energy-coupling factor transporter ATP-binding protein EcfA2
MRRVAFAIALSLEPELLLLDEPTSCLDAGGVAVLEAILAARRTGGGTTMVASHDVAFLAGVCDRIVWLDGGHTETVLVTAGADLASGEVWPGDPLDVLDLQERLAVRGLDVAPRALTAARLAARLERRPQGG